MPHPLGLDDDGDFKVLAHALAVTDTYPALLSGLRWPAEPGSELSRLDSEVRGTISVTDTLVASQRTAVASLRHLSALFQQDLSPRASVAVTLCRAALVGGSHLLYVLEPRDPADRAEHAQRLLNQQASSHLSALNAFSDFQHLQSLIPPDAVVAKVQEGRDQIGGKRARDGDVIADVAKTVALALTEHSGAQHASDVDTGALWEHLIWLWHAWSGIAHGWAWPKYVPGLEDEGHDVAPGHWPTDFMTVASLLQLGLDRLKASLFAAPYDGSVITGDSAN